MKNPHISVIIPVYNGENFLPLAIESALDQTIKPIQVIVIDDGSTDRSLEIAKSYEKRGATVIHQTNRGLSGARNTGIMASFGDYILPLDADDMLLPNCVEEVIKKIEETDADIIGISFKTFGRDNQDLILMEHPTLQDFRGGNRIAYCSAVRRSALVEAGGYSSRMVANIPGNPVIRWGGYEDFALWFDLLERGKTIVCLQDPLWLYRTADGTMIQTAQAHHAELMGQIIQDHPIAFPNA